jgi:hypothetical protein
VTGSKRNQKKVKLFFVRKSQDIWKKRNIRNKDSEKVNTKGKEMFPGAVDNFRVDK